MAIVFMKALGTEKLRRFKSLLGVLKMDLSLRGSVEISRTTLDVSLGLLSFMSLTFVSYTCDIVR